jgi:hypothetical protein
MLVQVTSGHPDAARTELTASSIGFSEEAVIGFPATTGVKVVVVATSELLLAAEFFLFTRYA